MKDGSLPFWSFFHDLEKKLSYERWIDKYQQFLQALSNGDISYDSEWKNFRQVCKIMFLQDFRDEAAFDKLLDAAIEKEKRAIEQLLTVKKVAEKKSKQTKAENKTTETEETPGPNPDPIIKPQVSETLMEEPADMKQTMNLQFLPMEAPTESHAVPVSESAIQFLHTDEYFPVTRRQMVKGWQFLRLKEKSDISEGLDLPETIRQVAREGLFLNPVYKTGERNREDTLIIFADYRGSMTPFHELTTRLIETARTGGGHPRAPVYYFQNHPVGYVFRNTNMSGPVKIKEALMKTNRNFTLAVVISDAGAARGNTNPERRKSRLDITSKFLEFLDETCAHTIWLNPMPIHRWKGNAAELISKKVFLMAPVLDRYGDKFQETLRTILKHQKPALTN